MTELLCRDLVELVTDYLEDRMPPADRERFEAHVAACAGCGRYVEQLRLTIELTGSLAEEDIAPPAREALLRAFSDWRRDR